MDMFIEAIPYMGLILAVACGLQLLFFDARRAQSVRHRVATILFGIAGLVLFVGFS